ncbi:LOW QUALITY PROTEIN: stonustoxin subunit beta-like [Morone saxatilis]|uniref:LOW QUALITY PROTEIN: stonustoxin subunit beta-like n=1 Tax=Morone saxatilis TaxID=34816 RepID=UPI0015E223B5|nr:LOW QUALITY PROTEIN: stonustoxin subunit beta-like [Morone saxatilis]
MDPESSRTIELAALGRPFGLGMLYDCRQDSLVPGMTLWDSNDLNKDTRESPKPNTDFEIVASESIEDKSSALNVEASLKASFLGGLIEVGGSAKYLNDHKTSKNQARVTLTYKATTKFQELSMDHLGRGNVKHPYVFDKGLATHVVTAILYGAQAFFVFDREVSEQEDHQDIEGNLKVMIKKIPCLAIEGEGSLKMEDKEKANVQKFSCRFYGDFSIQKPPTTFQDAVQIYQSLPQLLGANGENAVPMKVWLLPLTSLDSSAAKLVRQISIGLVQQSQSVLEDFSELEMRCNDALKTTTAQQFPQIGKKLKQFKEMCSEFKLGFQQTLAKKLPSIRGGGEEEAVLAEILKKRHSSPFNSKDLNEWMDCKEREIYTLKSFTNIMKNTKIVSTQNGLHEETISVEHSVCFVFTSLGSDEPFLSALSDCLKGTTKPDDPQHSHTHDVEKEQWYASNKVADAMRDKAKLFSDFAEANKENKNIKFLIVGLTNEKQKGSSIYLYKEGFSVSENFEPPSKALENSDTSATIKPSNRCDTQISPPRFGGENIHPTLLSTVSVEGCDGKQQTASGKLRRSSERGEKRPAELGQDVQIRSYIVEYAKTDNGMKEEDLQWNQMMSKAEKTIISELQSETEYVVRASLARLTATQRYVFDSVLSIFGKDVAENIEMMVTFADGKQPPVLEAINVSGVPCPKNDIGLPVHFKFNNSALFADNKCVSDGPCDEDSDEDDENFDEMFWNMGAKSMEKFFTALSKMTTKSLQMTQEVLKERKHLETAVEGLQPQVKAGLAKLQEIKTTKEKIKEHETAMTSNENFEIEVDVIKPVKKELTKKGEYITNCQNCSVTCHYPCAIADDDQKHKCTAMDMTGRCTVCPGKCIWNVHFNQTYSWEYVQVKEKKTLQELKEKYENATKEKMTVQELIERQEEEIVHLQEMIVSLMDQSAHSLTRLQEIALRPNPLTTPGYIDMLIEGEKSEAKEGYQARIQSLEAMKEKAKIISKVAKRDKLTKTDEELSEERQERQEKKGFLKKAANFFGFY